MIYSFFRAAQKLWKNRLIYLFLVIELSVGITVVLCGEVSVLYAKKRMVTYAAQIGASRIAIEYYSKEQNTVQAKPAITSEDYSAIQSGYTDFVEVSLILRYSTIYLKGGSDVKDITIVSMDENTFYSLFDLKPQADTVYMGIEIFNDMHQDSLQFFDSWFCVNPSGILIGESEITKINSLPSNTDSIYLSRSNELDLKVENMVVLPERFMKQMESSATDLFPFLFLTPIAESDDYQYIDNIVRLLASSHSGYTYQASESFLDLQKSVADLTQDIRLFSWIAVLSLAITTVGIIGVLLIFLEKRKREFAIILAVGGTHFTVFFEVFSEVFLLCLLGGIIGTIGCAIVAPHLSTSVFTVSFHWSCIAIMLMVALVITIISCMFVISGIQTVYPAQILRGN